MCKQHGISSARHFETCGFAKISPDSSRWTIAGQTRIYTFAFQFGKTVSRYHWKQEKFGFTHKAQKMPCSVSRGNSRSLEQSSSKSKITERDDSTLQIFFFWMNSLAELNTTVIYWQVSAPKFHSSTWLQSLSTSPWQVHWYLYVHSLFPAVAGRKEDRRKNVSHWTNEYISLKRGESSQQEKCEKCVPTRNPEIRSFEAINRSELFWIS